MKRCIGILLGILVFLGMHPVIEVYAAPEISAQAAILMEAGTFEVLYEKNAYEKRPMASTTKIMTTLLTLESGDLDTPFTVDSDAIRVEGSSMGLQEGDIVTRRALCWGMMLPSGNDAANAAAVSVAGSIPAFAALMNERAAEIGMTRTCFVTPSGLEGEGHGASAFDMALLTREALQNETFREICGQKSARLCFGDPPYERTLQNSNKLLGMYEGVIGVKTGFTDEAGRCLVSACERGGVTLICVTLHAADDWNDHMRLYDLGFSQVSAAAFPVPEELSIPVAGGVTEAVPLCVASPVTAGCRGGSLPEIEMRIIRAPFAYAPVQEGETLGTLEYWRDGRRLAQVSLTAGESVPAAAEPERGFWRRLKAWLGEIIP